VILNLIRDIVEVDQVDQLVLKVAVVEVETILGRFLKPDLKAPLDQSDQLVQQAVMERKIVLDPSPIQDLKDRLMILVTIVSLILTIQIHNLLASKMLHQYPHLIVLQQLLLNLRLQIMEKKKCRRHRLKL